MIDAKLGITVRFAENERDVRMAVSIGERYHLESHYADLAFDSERAVGFVSRGIETPNTHCALIAEKGSEMIGYLHATLGPHFFSADLAATLTTWYVVPEYRGSTAAIKLLHAFKRWATQRDAKRLYMTIASGIRPKQTDRLLRRLGFQVVGGSYTLGLENNVSNVNGKGHSK